MSNFKNARFEVKKGQLYWNQKYKNWQSKKFSMESDLLIEALETIKQKNINPEEFIINQISKVTVEYLEKTYSGDSMEWNTKLNEFYRLLSDWDASAVLNWHKTYPNFKVVAAFNVKSALSSIDYVQLDYLVAKFINECQIRSKIFTRAILFENFDDAAKFKLWAKDPIEVNYVSEMEPIFEEYGKMTKERKAFILSAKNSIQNLTEKKLKNPRTKRKTKNVNI